jgi:hypothetical protein
MELCEKAQLMACSVYSHQSKSHELTRSKKKRRKRKKRKDRPKAQQALERGTQGNSDVLAAVKQVRDSTAQ